MVGVRKEGVPHETVYDSVKRRLHVAHRIQMAAKYNRVLSGEDKVWGVWAHDAFWRINKSFGGSRPFNSQSRPLSEIYCLCSPLVLIAILSGSPACLIDAVRVETAQKGADTRKPVLT